VQLEDLVLLRRVGQRVLASHAAARDDQLHVLTGGEGQRLVEAEQHATGVTGDVLDRADGRHQVPQGVGAADVAGGGRCAHHGVPEGGGLAGQRHPGPPLLVGQGVGRRAAVVDLAVEDAELAGAAGALVAGVRHPHPGAEERVEHRLVGRTLDPAVADGE
jgi:hypothetical protein